MTCKPQVVQQTRMNNRGCTATNKIGTSGGQPLVVPLSTVRRASTFLKDLLYMRSNVIRPRISHVVLHLQAMSVTELGLPASRTLWKTNHAGQAPRCKSTLHSRVDLHLQAIWQKSGPPGNLRRPGGPIKSWWNCRGSIQHVSWTAAQVGLGKSQVSAFLRGRRSRRFP